MNTITKPFLFFVFIMGFIFFINLVLLFITINQTNMFMDDAALIAENNASNIEQAQQEINSLVKENDNKFQASFEYYYDNEYLDSTKLIVTTEYDYLGRNKVIPITTSKIIMNKQI